MARNKPLSADGALGTLQPTEIELAPKQLWIVRDQKSENAGTNIKIISILVGNDDTLEERKVTFQFQIPRGPGLPAQEMSHCPNCKAPFPRNAVLHLAATRETEAKNQVSTQPETKVVKLIRELGAELMDA